MATAIEAAIIDEIVFHMDDMQGSTVLDAEEHDLGALYGDTSQKDLHGNIYPPNEVAVVLSNGKRFKVTVQEEKA